MKTLYIFDTRAIQQSYFYRGNVATFLLLFLSNYLIFFMNIFCTKLSSETKSEHLNDLFAKFGAVESAKVIIDKETGNSKCFGFVEMSDDSEAESAIEKLNESEFMGRIIVVKKARPKEEGGSHGGGSHGGSHGGGNYKPRRDNNGGGGYGGGGYNRR